MVDLYEIKKIVSTARKNLVVQLVCKASSRRIKPSVAGSIPALAAIIEKTEVKMNVPKIPSIEKMLEKDEIKKIINQFGREIVVSALREIFQEIRNGKYNQTEPSDAEKMAVFLKNMIEKNFSSTLKRVINATGIILHTNLGRAPLGKKIIDEIYLIANGYSNLEFDLEKGKRGNRNSHIKNLIKNITQSEDAVVVNNNAAAVMLTLKTLAEGKEVIISRGELIEIGGSFRIPDIMKASGAKMVEVGTTNRTKLSDYENAINENTVMILKAHKSNYFIGGFTEEVELKELSELAHKHNLIMYYDLGSGLLRKPKNLPLEDEPDVSYAVKSGADVISFSGDKLLGGSQAGIIIGKSKFISKIEKNPMMRAFRVGKLTLAALSFVMKSYMSDKLLVENIPVFSYLARSEEFLFQLAKNLQKRFDEYDISSEIVSNKAKCGGGTLPHLEIKSYAVKLKPNKKIKASVIYHKLLEQDIPVLSILRKGELFFDVLVLDENDFDIIATNLKKVL